MELRQLRHFLAIIDNGSFSSAAVSVGLTQQTLSKSIANLEHDLGVRLFDRDTRNIALTTHGQMLMSHARNIDAEAHQLRRHLDDALGIRSGHLRIGAGLTAATQIVPDAVDQLIVKRPTLRITVVDGSSTTLIPMLLRGELDVIVCVVGNPINDPIIQQDILFQEKMRLLAGSAHPLTITKRVRLARTLDFPWLVGWSPGGLDKAISQTFARSGLKPPIPKIESTSFTFVRTVLAKSDHVAVLPEHLFTSEIESGTLSRINLPVSHDGWERPMSICYRRNSTRSPATMAFVNELANLSGRKAAIPGLSVARSSFSARVKMTKLSSG